MPAPVSSRHVEVTHLRHGTGPEMRLSQYDRVLVGTAESQSTRAIALCRPGLVLAFAESRMQLSPLTRQSRLEISERRVEQ